ncbi:hypothetical protein [Leclercia pneumoniae]|uniref:hypothetical protein n=1 Tax=Leclercia pneumoniae TaxID=2815358 RepID=UPI003AF610F5
MTVSEDQSGMKRAPVTRGELPVRADTGNSQRGRTACVVYTEMIPDNGVCHAFT